MTLRHTMTLALALTATPLAAGRADELYGAPPPDLKRHLDRLVAAYPDWIAGYDETHLRMKDGTSFVISDKLTNKSFDALLEKPDIDDMFYVSYPKGSPPAPPAKNVDPGRVRFEPLFVKMYGDCKKSNLAGSLRSIEWLPRHKGGRVLVTTVNGVDKALEQVSRELDALPADLIKYAKPSAGTYACRMVAGSSVRSMHAYANAIDVNTRYSAYWRWS
jgi:hypothetical protein